MSIYSSNRSGTIDLSTIAIDEAYGDSISTILSETEANDMAFFEAVLYSDFNEIHGLREGVLTEAEAEAQNNKDTDSLGKKIVERLKKFWAKIKAFLKATMDKIISYASGDGVGLTNKIKAAIRSNPTWKGQVKFKMYDLGGGIYDIPEEILNYDFRNAGPSDTYKKTVNRYLAKNLGRDDATPSNYAMYALEASAKDEVIGIGNISDYYTYISDAKTWIDAVKREEKQAEGIVRDAANVVKKDLKMKDVMAVNHKVSALETVISTVCKAHVGAIRANIASVRVALGKALSSIKKEPAPKQEAAVLEACEEIDLAFNYPTV